jgi:hypothetical protein
VNKQVENVYTDVRPSTRNNSLKNFQHEIAERPFQTPHKLVSLMRTQNKQTTINDTLKKRKKSRKHTLCFKVMWGAKKSGQKGFSTAVYFSCAGSLCCAALSLFGSLFAANAAAHAHVGHNDRAWH